MTSHAARNIRIAIWGGCVALLVGDLQVISVFESSIATTVEASRQINAAIASNEAVIARRNRLRSEEQQALQELLPLSSFSNNADEFAQFMKNMNHLADSLGVQVVSTGVSLAKLDAKHANGARLSPTNVTLLVRGSFASVVRFVQEMSRQRPVSEIALPKFSADRRMVSKGWVMSTIQLTVYRVLLEPLDPSHA